MREPDEACPCHTDTDGLFRESFRHD